ncbi:serine hydrolase domain-containing protein [Kordiimonas sp.]|uniref:serine hydrolase domain-containing protein n=1 Tax=Kordiimonas sp. TaxID=1970157 RepID=UPI003A90C658
MRILFSVLIFSLFSAGSTGANDAVVQAFDKEFTEEFSKNKVPGAAYAIVKDGRVVALKTMGTRAVDADLPVNSATVFRLASVSKTFAAELAAMLALEGKFSLDARIVGYVPNLKFKDAGHASGIKIRHLLSHSAGVTPNAYDNMLEDDWGLEKIIPRFDQIAAMCKPGDCYGYQNILFSLVQPVMEQTTGETYRGLVSKRLLEPLDMDHSSVGLESFLSTANRAEPHVFTRRNGWTRVLVEPNYYRVSPAAGVNASIEDMAKWLIAQMGYRSSVISPELLETVTSKEVRTTRELNRRAWRRHISDAHYGLGWRIYSFSEDEVILHSGAVRGYRAFISYSKKLGLGLVMLMNAQTRSIDRLSVSFWDEAFDARDAMKEAEENKQAR